MPIYEYRCENGHVLEVMQKITDDPITSCSTCGAAVQRVFHPVAVHYKGSGFYSTDYGRKKKGSAKDKDAAGGSSSSDGGSSSSSSSESSGSGSGETKKAAEA